MVQSRSGLKLLGLCALMLGLMTFVTNSAHAEAGSKWTLLNEALTVLSEVTTTLLPEVTAEIDVTPILLAELSKKAIALSCTSVAIEGAKLKTSGTLGEGKATFTGCTFAIGGVVQPSCKPHSAGDPEGTIKSNPAHGLLRLHSGTLTVLVLPTTGINGTFAMIVLGKEGVLNECAVGEKITVNGELSIQDCLKEFTQHKVKHLINEFAALTDLWILNKTAEHKATIDGSAWAFLIGEHKGMLFAGLA
jgi:hypothetical protein